jgi:hypothetical protein
VYVPNEHTRNETLARDIRAKFDARNARKLTERFGVKVVSAERHTGC